VPPADVKDAAAAIQESFRELDWVAPLPDYFLHVSTPLGFGRDVAPFPINYRGVNCFHDAVLVETHVDGVFPPPPFLPHLSIGYFRRSEPADRLRDKLVPLRDVELGSGIVEEVLLCHVPYAKTTFFEPWTIVETIRLRERPL
jgi:hypothetical protein